MAPCGGPCPVPERAPRHVRTAVWPVDTVVRRGHSVAHPDATQVVPGLGDTRFAPLDEVAHTYLATTRIGALLESVLHDAAPPAPRIQMPTVRAHMESAVRLTAEVRLVDLRDPELDRHGIARDQLVSTPPMHYRCTRQFASQLHGRAVGGQQTHGLLWHSRQAELHAAAAAGQGRPAYADVVGEHPTEVAVLWSPPAPGGLLAAAPGGLGPLDRDDGWDYLLSAMDLLGILLDPG